MSAITIDNDLVHYEVLGRGRPVIFVHGWLGSWRYWMPTMQQLSTKYRTYALDLWGFGDTGKDTSKYTFSEQVKLLSDFMEKLGIPKAALVGHSFGAALCLRFASQYPDRAPRLMLISPPLTEASGSDMPATSPTPPIAALAAAPVNVTPAPAMPAAPAPATPAQPPTPTQQAAPAPTPVPTPAPAAQPAPATPAAAAPAQTQAAPTPPAPGAAGSTPVPASKGDTLPKNPFKGMGGSAAEILANVQAKNAASTSNTPAPATPAQPTTPPAQAAPAATQAPAPTPGNGTTTAPAQTPTPAPATGAVLPSGIGTPMPQPAPIPSATTPAPAQPATPAAIPRPTASAGPASANPLMPKLTGSKPSALLTKYLDREANSEDYKFLRTEAEKTDEAAIARSVQSFTGLNIAAELQRLPVPTLLLHGKDDPVLDAPSEDLLEKINRGKPKGQFLHIVEPDLRHFPMLEITAKFNRLLMDFLEATDLVNIQFKDQWKRTMR